MSDDGPLAKIDGIDPRGVIYSSVIGIMGISRVGGGPREVRTSDNWLVVKNANGSAFVEVRFAGTLGIRGRAQRGDRKILVT